MYLSNQSRHLNQPAQPNQPDRPDYLNQLNQPAQPNRPDVGRNTVLFPQSVLTTAYFPPIEYFFAIACSGETLVERHESYQKQSYRNRCVIYSASGAYPLSIPIEKSARSMAIGEVRIDYSEPWIQHHVRALEAAYNSSAFFEYYRDELFEILNRRYVLLWELNSALLEKLLEMSGIRASIRTTDTYVDSYGEYDFRTRVQPKYKGITLLEQYGCQRPYFQVFPSGRSFIGNLSIIDLLSAEGPNALSFLTVQ